jgi:DNA-binding response OmpR family regulator/curved DNA-binding protein CbpA
MSSEGDKKHILIVDDDANIRRFLSESLRLRGYQVHSFEEAEAALRELDNLKVDLVLLDVLPPGTNGLQLCGKLRALSKTGDLPIVVMTAFYKQADSIRDAREQYGATDYLLKPFPLKTLQEKVEALIGAPTAAVSSERLSIEGNLAESDFPRILHNLYGLRATGLLHLEYKNLKKVVYIRDGYPIFVRSNLVREFLGQRLLRAGLLTEDQLRESLDRAKPQGQRHGIALIEMRLLTPHQLHDILREQVLEKILGIFAWPEGRYRFLQVREFKQNVTSINLSPANLILQGLRKHASRTQLAKMLEPHLDHYLQEAESPLYRFQEIDLTGNDQRILDNCKGNVTLNEILQRHILTRNEVEPLLAALLSTGILVSVQEEPAAAEEVGAEETEELRARRVAFMKDYTWMMGQDYFTLLGVSETGSREQVRKAYHGLVKQYHPDRFFEQDVLVDLRDKVNALFQRISDAHETLVDEQAKAHYVNDLKAESRSSSATPEKFLKAEDAYQKGMACLRLHKYRDAEKAFAEALELRPNEAEYLLYQAWSSYKAEPKTKEVMNTARKNLMRATELSPKLSMGHLYLGYICKDQGQQSEAQRHFERAILYNPKCTEALRELRLMGMRKGQEGEEKKNLFGKMFR